MKPTVSEIIKLNPLLICICRVLGSSVANSKSFSKVVSFAKTLNQEDFPR